MPQRIEVDLTDYLGKNARTEVDFFKPPKPEEVDFFSGQRPGQSLWDWANEPTSTIPSEIGNYLSDALNLFDPASKMQSPDDWLPWLGATAKGFGQGALEAAGDLGSSLTSRLNLATTAAAGGSNLALRAGAPILAEPLNLITKGLSVPVTAHGALETGRGVADIFDPGVPVTEALAQIGRGTAEMAGGGLGMAHVPNTSGPILSKVWPDRPNKLYGKGPFSLDNTKIHRGEVVMPFHRDPAAAGPNPWEVEISDRDMARRMREGDIQNIPVQILQDMGLIPQAPIPPVPPQIRNRRPFAGGPTVPPSKGISPSNEMLPEGIVESGLGGPRQFPHDPVVDEPLVIGGPTEPAGRAGVEDAFGDTQAGADDVITVPTSRVTDSFLRNMEEGGYRRTANDGNLSRFERVSGEEGSDQITMYLLSRAVDKLRKLFGREPSPDEILDEVSRSQVPEGETRGRVANFPEILDRNNIIEYDDLGNVIQGMQNLQNQAPIAAREAAETKAEGERLFGVPETQERTPIDDMLPSTRMRGNLSLVEKMKDETGAINMDVFRRLMGREPSEAEIRADEAANPRMREWEGPIPSQWNYEGQQRVRDFESVGEGEPYNQMFPENELATLPRYQSSVHNPYSYSSTAESAEDYIARRAGDVSKRIADKLAESLELSRQAERTTDLQEKAILETDAKAARNEVNRLRQEELDPYRARGRKVKEYEELMARAELNEAQGNLQKADAQRAKAERLILEEGGQLALSYAQKKKRAGAQLKLSEEQLQSSEDSLHPSDYDDYISHTWARGILNGIMSGAPGLEFKEVPTYSYYGGRKEYEITYRGPDGRAVAHAQAYVKPDGVGRTGIFAADKDRGWLYGRAMFEVGKKLHELNALRPSGSYSKHTANLIRRLREMFGEGADETGAINFGEIVSAFGDVWEKIKAASRYVYSRITGDETGAINMEEFHRIMGRDPSAAELEADEAANLPLRKWRGERPLPNSIYEYGLEQRIQDYENVPEGEPYQQQLMSPALFERPPGTEDIPRPRTMEEAFQERSRNKAAGIAGAMEQASKLEKQAQKLEAEGGSEYEIRRLRMEAKNKRNLAKSGREHDVDWSFKPGVRINKSDELLARAKMKEATGEFDAADRFTRLAEKQLKEEAGQVAFDFVKKRLGGVSLSMEQLTKALDSMNPTAFMPSLSHGYAQGLAYEQPGPPKLTVTQRYGNAWDLIYRSADGQRAIAKAQAFQDANGERWVNSFMGNKNAGGLYGRAVFAIGKELIKMDAAKVSGNYSRHTANLINKSMRRLAGGDESGFINMADIFEAFGDGWETFKKAGLEALDRIKRSMTDETGAVNPQAVARAKDEPGFIENAVGFTTGITTSGDLSAPLRQGLTMIFTPEWRKAIAPMFKAAWSADKAKVIDKQIKSLKAFKPRVDLSTGKVSPSFAESLGYKHIEGSNINASEAGLSSKWLESGGSIPGLSPLYRQTVGRYVRASNRGYAAFLNHLRANSIQKLLDAGQDMAVSAKATGEARPGFLKQKFTPEQAAELNPYKNLEEARAIIDAVNTLTGRGPLKFDYGGKKPLDVEFLAKPASYLLYAPRLIASRVRMLNPFTYTMASPAMRKQYLLGAASAVGAWGTILGLASQHPDVSVSMDSDSSDFGKIRIGDTRLDPGGGFLQFYTAMHRMIWSGGWTSSRTNQFRRFGKGYRAETKEDATERFFINKLNPVAKAVVDAWSASEQQPFHVMDRTVQMFVPLLEQDAWELMQERPDLWYLLAPIAFGMGTQTYGKGESVGKMIPTQNDILLKGGEGLRNIFMNPRPEPQPNDLFDNLWSPEPSLR